MSFNLKTVLDLCPTLKKDQNYILSEKESSQLESKYLISNENLNQYRSDFKSYVSTFQTLVNKLNNIELENSINEKSSKDYKPKEVPKELFQQSYDTVLKGIKLISVWKTHVFEQSAWKYSHPAPIEQCQLDAIQILKMEEEKDGIVNEGETKNMKEITIGEYERVVRFNYTQPERSILVEMISMIKSVEKLLLPQSSKLLPLIRTIIFKDLQIFIQVTLNDMITKSKKNKKNPGLAQLLELRDLAVDWKDGKEVDTSKFSKEKYTEFVNEREIGPSHTQLHLIRTLLSSLYSVRNPGMIKKGFLSSVDFSSNQCSQMQDFYESSFIWSYLLNYGRTVREAADLSDLWYKEFYLQLAQKIQFPIKMSLPWILTEEIIEHRNTALMESIIYPLDLYNDAAFKALFVLKKKYIYDEIEAEVNLVFDQLVYKLSEQIYSYYKIISSNVMFDTKFRVYIEKVFKGSRLR
jgi:cytoplasmic FMR1 interacting protein